MSKKNWKEELQEHFENIRILEKCQAETTGHFEQFCEFIVEPAFEELADELAERGIRAKFQKFRSREIRMVICFPGGKEEQFRYRLILPKNSVELKLILKVEGKKTRHSDFSTRQEQFMPDVNTAEILKLDKEDVILHLIERYRDFIYQTLTSPD